MSESSHQYGYVYTCYDPEIRDEILRCCEERFGHKQYFFDSDPGATKNLINPHQKAFPAMVLWKMLLGIKVHPYTHLLLINHSICGAYADDGIHFTDSLEEQTYHREQLEKAMKFLIIKLPNHITIETHYFLKKEQKFAW